MRDFNWTCEEQSVTKLGRGRTLSQSRGERRYWDCHGPTSTEKPLVMRLPGADHEAPASDCPAQLHHQP